MFNDAEIYEIGKATAEELFGDDVWNMIESVSMGGEDFGFVSNAVASLQVSLGHRSPEHETDRTASNHHNPLFEMDERMIPRGSAYLASLAVNVIERFNAEKNAETGSTEL